MNDCVNKPGCIEAALHIIGDQWTALILRDLALAPCTFSQLETSLQSISPRTLSQRLEHLVNQQIIEKQLYCPHPPRYHYALTKKGRELQEVLEKMAEWGEKYRPHKTE